MLIQSEYDIQFHLPGETPMVALLHLHPSLGRGACGPSDELSVEHIDASSSTSILPESYTDSFGNRCAAFPRAAGSAAPERPEHESRSTEIPDAAACGRRAASGG